MRPAGEIFLTFTLSDNETLTQKISLHGYEQPSTPKIKTEITGGIEL